MELDIRHMAADAIRRAPLVCVKSSAVVAGMAFRVVKAGIVPACVLMRDMTRCARQLSDREAAALHQAQRLKTQSFERCVSHRRLGPMAIAAKPNLLRSGELAG